MLETIFSFFNPIATSKVFPCAFGGRDLNPTEILIYRLR